LLIHGTAGELGAVADGREGRLERDPAHQKAPSCVEAGGYLLSLTLGELWDLALDLDDPETGPLADCGTDHMKGQLGFLVLSSKTAGERIGENLAIKLVRDYAYSATDAARRRWRRASS